MREILFRGKRVDNGEWVNGNYVEKIHYYDGERFPCIQVVMQKPSVADRFVPCFETAELVEVIPETVGQYTGIKDKNGKMIFEGDMIKCIGTVEWLKTQSRFMIWLPKSNKFASFLAGIEYEVIGNIHDKPELLEVGE